MTAATMTTAVSQVFVLGAKLVGISAYLVAWAFAYGIAIGAVLGHGVATVTGLAWVLSGFFR